MHQHRHQHLRREPLADDLVDTLLNGIEQPARYTGGELNAVVKSDPVAARVVLAFPDLYEVAESHIGLKILYDVVNRHADWAAERVYAVAPDLEARLRETKTPLWSLETRRPLSAFDLVGITLQYEQSYTTLLAMLELGGITLRSEARAAHEPFVIGGGAGAYNPEPVAPFFDALLLGDGEEALPELIEVITQGRARGASRADILLELARVPGVYVPSFFEVDYDGRKVSAIRAKPGTPYADTRSKHGTPRVVRRVITDLDAQPFPTQTIVPNVRPVHERVAVEIQRGCSQACRFCQAGMITRPTRQRRPETVLRLVDEVLKNTGSDEVGLLSLSAGDYAPINDVLEELFRRYRDDRIAVGLPSIRTETMTPQLASQVAQVRKTGFTLAPEAATDRMRAVINKTNREEDLLAAVRATVKAGWEHLKFYFMMGLPTETDRDVEAIVHLGAKAREAGREQNPKVQVTVSVSTFVPKPHTPFQWERQASLEETYAKHRLLRAGVREARVGFRYHAPEQSYIEGVLSRGDRRLAGAIEHAMHAGARLDAWSEHFDYEAWQRALDETLTPLGLTADDYLAARAVDEVLPWDHLDAGILKKYLVRERERAYAAATIVDCALQDQCFACGGCDLGNPYNTARGSDGKREVVLRPIVHAAQVREPSGTDSRRGELEPAQEQGGRASAEQALVASAPSELAPSVPVTRLRLRYARMGRAIHLSQLDTMDQWLKAVRLAKLPAAYTLGYRKGPRISFSPGLPSGVSSHAEYMELDLTQERDARACAEALARWLPSGMDILDAELVPAVGPTITQYLTAMHYSVTPPSTVSRDQLVAAVEQFVASRAVWVRVKRKGEPRTLNARDYVTDVAIIGRTVRLTMPFSEQGNLKIVEAVAVLFGPEAARATRIVKEGVELADLAAKHRSAPLTAPSSPERFTAGDAQLDLLDVAGPRGVARRAPKDRAAVVVPYAE